MHFEKYLLSAKISMNGHRFLLRLQEANIAMTVVFRKGTTHQESPPVVERLRYWSSLK